MPTPFDQMPSHSARFDHRVFSMQISAALRDLLACPFSYVRYVYAFRHPGRRYQRLVRNRNRPVWRSRFRRGGYGTRPGYRTFAKHGYRSGGTISIVCSSCGRV